MQQAKAKLADVNMSTGIRNSKILIGELCTVISFLLKEIDSIQSQPISLSSTKPIDPLSDDDGPYSPLKIPHRSPPISDSVRAFRKDWRNND